MRRHPVGLADLLADAWHVPAFSDLTRDLISWRLWWPGQAGLNTGQTPDLAPRHRGQIPYLTSNGLAYSGLGAARSGGRGAVTTNGTTGVAIARIHPIAPPFAFCAWYRATANDTPTIAVASASDSTAAFAWGQATGSKITIYQNGTGITTSTGTITTGQWNFVAVNVVAANLRQIFLNGVLDTSDTTTQTLPTAALDRIVYAGNRATGTIARASGYLDDVRVYERSLTASDVRRLYDLSRGGYSQLLSPSRPARYWWIAHETLTDGTANATITATRPAATADPNATSTPPTFTANVAATRPAATAAANATSTPPTFTANVTATRPAATAAANATSTPPTFTANVTASRPAATATAHATAAAPGTAIATITASRPAATAAANATSTPPTFTANVTATRPAATAAASALRAPATATITAIIAQAIAAATVVTTPPPPPSTIRPASHAVFRDQATATFHASAGSTFHDAAHATYHDA